MIFKILKQYNLFEEKFIAMNLYRKEKEERVLLTYENADDWILYFSILRIVKYLILINYYFIL